MAFVIVPLKHFVALPYTILSLRTILLFKNLLTSLNHPIQAQAIFHLTHSIGVTHLQKLVHEGVFFATNHLKQCICCIPTRFILIAACMCRNLKRKLIPQVASLISHFVSGDHDKAILMSGPGAILKINATITAKLVF